MRGHRSAELVFVAAAHPKRLGPLGCMGVEIAIIGIEKLPPALLQQPRLDAAVALERAMAIEMVRGQRGPNTNAGLHRWRRFDLIAAEFHHHPFRLLPLEAGEGEFSGGGTDVAASRSIEAPLLQQMGHQGRDSGFAIGAGDPNPGDARHGLPGHFHFTDDAAAPIAQLVEHRMIEGNARADHHCRGPAWQGLKALQSQGLAQLHLNADGVELIGPSFQLSAAVALQQPHVGTARVEEPRCADARAAQTHHHDRILHAW